MTTPKLTTRLAAVVAIGALAVLTVPTAPSAYAQSTYPSQPVQVLVGFSAGSSTDIVTRIITTELAKRLGQPVVVENRPGAAGVVATSALVRTAPDGYTLLMATSGDTISPSLNSAVKYDIAKDVAPVATVAEMPFVLLVQASDPANRVQDLVAAAKSKSGSEMFFASSGTGTLNHLFGELFSLNTGAKLTHVPYRGGPQAVADLMTGRVNIFFSPAAAALGHIKSGKLKALAIVGRKRFAALPDVPTFAEAGIEGFDTPLWFGLLAPAGTPAPILERLNQETVHVLGLDHVQQQLKSQGAEPLAGSRTQIATTIANDFAKWARVISVAGVAKN